MQRPRPRRSIAIRRAKQDDIAAMSRMLAEAYHDDPTQRWLFPDDSKRMEQCTRFFEALSGMPMGQQAWTTAGMVGGAVWFEPGAWPIGAVAAARQAPVLLKILGRRAPLALAGLAAVERNHPKEPAHWYLANIGTHPEHRRRGHRHETAGRHPGPRRSRWDRGISRGAKRRCRRFLRCVWLRCQRGGPDSPRAAAISDVARAG